MSFEATKEQRGFEGTNSGVTNSEGALSKMQNEVRQTEQPAPASQISDTGQARAQLLSTDTTAVAEDTGVNLDLGIGVGPGGYGAYGAYGGYGPGYGYRPYYPPRYYPPVMPAPYVPSPYLQTPYVPAPVMPAPVVPAVPYYGGPNLSLGLGLGFGGHHRW